MNQNDNVLLTIVPRVRDCDAAQLYNGKFTAGEIEQLNSAILIDMINHSHRTQTYKFVIHTIIPGYEEFLTPHLLTNIELHAAGESDPHGYSYSLVLDRMKDKAGWNSLVMLVGFHPLVTSAHIHNAFNILDHDENTIVYGSTDDGNLYICGMRAEQSSFQNMGDGIFSNQEAFLRRFCVTENMIVPLETIAACSTIDDLQSVQKIIEEKMVQHQFYPKRTIEFLKLHERRLNHPRVIE